MSPREVIELFFARYADGELDRAAELLDESFRFFGRPLPPADFAPGEPSEVEFIVDRELSAADVEALAEVAEVPLFDDDPPAGEVILGGVKSPRGTVPAAALVTGERIRGLYDPAAIALALGAR
jgi:hypothetical protein